VEAAAEECLPLYQQLKQHRLEPLPVLPDDRNADIYVHVGGELLPREEAKVSVFDSVVQGGDAVWEGLRVYDGRVFELDEHIDRMHNSAKTLLFENVPSRTTIKEAVFATLKKNGMYDNAHIRLTLTRGTKVGTGGPSAEHKYTDRQTHRYTDKQTNTQTNTQASKQTNK